jgi:hypothetical protein
MKDQLILPAALSLWGDPASNRNKYHECSWCVKRGSGAFSAFPRVADTRRTGELPRGR